MALRFKLRQLEMFVAVAESLNYREAAERLHMTQPPLSRQISALEEALGIRLLNRANTGVTLTAAGESFLDEARTLLAASEAMGNRFCASFADASAELKIGLTTVVDTETLQQVLPGVQLAMPNRTIAFKRQSSIKSVRDVLRHRLDAAIIGMPSATGRLTVRRLYRDRFCVALPAGHRLRNKKIISLKSLNDDVLLWFRRELNPHFYDACETVFAANGFAPKRTPEPVDHHVLLSMVANHGGIGLMPRSLQAIRRSGVIYRELAEADQLFIDVSIAYDAASMKPGLARFVENLAGFYK